MGKYVEKNLGKNEVIVKKADLNGVCHTDFSRTNKQPTIFVNEV